MSRRKRRSKREIISSIRDRLKEPEGMTIDEMTIRSGDPRLEIEATRFQRHIEKLKKEGETDNQ